MVSSRVAVLRERLILPYLPALANNHLLAKP